MRNDEILEFIKKKYPEWVFRDEIIIKYPELTNLPVKIKSLKRHDLIEESILVIDYYKRKAYKYKPINEDEF